MENFKNDMANFLESDPSNHPAESNWQSFKSAITAAAEKHIPQKIVRSFRKTPWFTRNLRRMMKKKQWLHNHAKKSGSSKAWVKFKSYRKKTKTDVNKTRNSFVSNLLNNNRKDRPKKFWKYVKSKHQDKIGIRKDKANILNKQFHSMYTKEDSSNISSKGVSPTPSIGYLKVTTTGVLKLLQRLKPNKASGPD